MNTVKQILLVVVLLVVATFLYSFGKVINNETESPSETSATSTPRVGEIDTTTWVTYTNEAYGFEILHPQDWRVATSGHPAEPIINIYPQSETEQPPFIHHNIATNVSIFPGGVPTEGIFGDSATSTVPFTEPVLAAIDFTLRDGSRWGTYAVFENPGVGWQEWGFIWARAPVSGLQELCVIGEQEIPGNDCPIFDNPDARVVREGVIDERVRAIEIEMLKSFRFIQ